MIKIIIAVLVVAGLYFAYINMGSINKNVEKSVQSSTKQMKSEKVINSVDAGRKRAIKDSESVTGKY